MMVACFFFGGINGTALAATHKPASKHEHSIIEKCKSKIGLENAIVIAVTVVIAGGLIAMASGGQDNARHQTTNTPIIP